MRPVISHLQNNEFPPFFADATGFAPYEWQVEVATRGLDGVLPVPTGLGKTEGVALAWAWRFAALAEEPRHLVYCLPMRTLVRQTFERLQGCFQALKEKRSLDVRVYQLMGGAIDEDWARLPEEPWVLVGTQDQLLSRALNRGYAMRRFDWSVHFGLLNNDCRWVVDETQLMGPGLWTTAQLDWMRQERFPCVKPCRTTWMSATAGSDFLATADRKRDGLDRIRSIDLCLDDDPHPEMRRRRAARRAAEWLTREGARTVDPQFVASEVNTRHQAGTLSLVVCNTVEAARDVFGALRGGPPKILLTSRFRRRDRDQHEQRLLDFERRRREYKGGPIAGDPGLVCVSTQVVEAGIDVSAHQLWSELAPWPSVIQRLGRLNRDGADQDARAWFWEMTTKARKQDPHRVGPYDRDDVELAKELVGGLIDLSRKRPFADALRVLARRHANDANRALQPKAAPMPRALDIHSLFSTERDVHGGFTDVSAFVRGTDPDPDLTVLWRYWDQGKERKTPPAGDELDGPPLDLGDEGCPVPFFRLREFLNARLVAAWTWNDDDGAWERVDPDDVRPGMAVMLHRDAGGYDASLGWTGNKDDTPGDVSRAGRGRALPDDERTETGSWVAVDTHLSDARAEAERLCDAVGLDERLRRAVVEAAALHDLGKLHPRWQQALPAVLMSSDGPWAKCPSVLGLDVEPEKAAVVRDEVAKRLLAPALALPDEKRQRDAERIRLRWAVAMRLKRKEVEQLKKLDGVYWAGHVPLRPGMRHEAVSALAMWARYRAGGASYPALSVYLAAAHHGKVRTVLRAITDGGDDVFGVSRDSQPLDALGARWPLDFSVAKDGAEGEWRDDAFILSGHGWTGLVADLLGPWQKSDFSEAGVVPQHEPRRLGPFALAYLEALVRTADWCASERPSRAVGVADLSNDR